MKTITRFVLGYVSLYALMASAQPTVPAGTIDPSTIPKYVIPLVIPPIMKDTGTANDYEIAVRQFSQQILPGGIWNQINGRDDPFPATPVWSYGPSADPTPVTAPDPGSQFNYPAYTIETRAHVAVAVEWRNELVQNPEECDFQSPVGDPDCAFRPHLLPVDQTLHWANPPKDCIVGPARTDCAGDNPAPYTGPVPIVTHVHGAHVEGHSDGYPEAWWLPRAGNIPAGYATSGRVYDDALGGAGDRGIANFAYRQDQPASTLWYHDHTLGMTRANVYAGPAGFWLVRGRPGMEVQDHDAVFKFSKKGAQLPARLPGPAPARGQTVLELNLPDSPIRKSVREIPIAIQDRTFRQDGSLFYPDNRAFFEGLNVEGTAGTPAAQFPGQPELQIDFVPDSDIAPIWNPEAFFNVMVVNGVSWPSLRVAPAKYRFRLLNGCNSRFLNLALVYPEEDGEMAELPFVQIGAEQGFLPQPAEVLTGFATPITDGRKPRQQDRVPAAHPQQALLMTLAERADVIVDFGDLPDGAVVRMINTAPDAPFAGFPDEPADPDSTGQVMQFVVDHSLWLPSDDDATNPYQLVLNAEPPVADPVAVTRQLSLNEGESEEVCFEVDALGNVVQVPGSYPEDCLFDEDEIFGPKEALLGLVDLGGAIPEGIALKWTDNTGASTPVNVTLQSGAVVTVSVSENPLLGNTEEWEIYNFTADAHPIHLHLVRFQVIGRKAIPGFDPVAPVVQPWEAGFKDTVIAYPGEITTVRATFDIDGLYVWHCHIVEHEDNEMMRPFVVSAD